MQPRFKAFVIIDRDILFCNYQSNRCKFLKKLFSQFLYRNEYYGNRLITLLMILQFICRVQTKSYSETTDKNYHNMDNTPQTDNNYIELSATKKSENLYSCLTKGNRQ